MNLYFKGDYYFDCEFSEEEQYWVDRACNNSSFEEVYQNPEELYEYLKEKYSKEVLENVKYDLDDFSLNDSGEYVDGAYTPSHWLWDVAARYMPNDEWDVLLAVENIFDKQVIVSRRPFGARPNQPLSVKAGVTYSF